MHAIISEYDIIKAYGDTMEYCASQALNWKVDYNIGELIVDDKTEMSYTRYHDDSLNGFTHEEMIKEAHKDLIKIAKRKRYKFFQQIN